MASRGHRRSPRSRSPARLYPLGSRCRCPFQVKNEPIKDMSGNITEDLIEKLLDRYYDGDTSKVPTIDYLAPPPPPPPPPPLVKSIKAKGSPTFHIPTPVPDTDLWLENLAGPHPSWLRALLTSSTIVRGSSYIDNPIRHLLAPLTGQKVVIHLEGTTPTGIDVFGAIRSYGPQQEDFNAVKIKYTPGTGAIDITVFEERRGIAVPLSMKFILSVRFRSTRSQTVATCTSGNSTGASGSVTMRPSHLSAFEKLSTAPRSPLL